MSDPSPSLEELRHDFRSGSTNSMPQAGLICWAALGTAAFFLKPQLVGNLALYIMAAILPLAFLLDKIKGRNLFAGGNDPLTKMFLTSIVSIGLTVPLVVIAAKVSGDSFLLLLGMAILAGIIWIPYGWAADDPVGLRHAIGRSIGCYLAYAYAPENLIASAICGVVVLSYVYSLHFMKKVGPS